MNNHGYIKEFGFWDKNRFVNIFFNGDEQIETAWVLKCTELLKVHQLPTKNTYDDFIKENTPKYFPPIPELK